MKFSILGGFRGWTLPLSIRCFCSAKKTCGLTELKLGKEKSTRSFLAESFSETLPGHGHPRLQSRRSSLNGSFFLRSKRWGRSSWPTQNLSVLGCSSIPDKRAEKKKKNGPQKIGPGSPLFHRILWGSAGSSAEGLHSQKPAGSTLTLNPKGSAELREPNPTFQALRVLLADKQPVRTGLSSAKGKKSA